MPEMFIGNIRGLKGDTGTGLTIKDFYSSVEELSAAVPTPNDGDAYGIGEAEPYDIYIYSQSKGWVNSGSLQPDINDQAPNYAEATTLETLTSGEKISIAFGKIKKAIRDLISHIGNTSNPHGITVNQIGAAHSNHSHTANNLMVKSIGVGTNIPENSDLNSYTTIGNYVCSLTATALSLTNCPSRGAFTMTVGYATGSSSYLYQEITHFSTGVKYYRTYTASNKEWSEWRTTYSTSNKPTPADIGASMIETKPYTGNGKYGFENARTHTFSFQPKLFYISGYGRNGGNYTLTVPYGFPFAHTVVHTEDGFATMNCEFRYNGNSITVFNTTSANNGFNTDGKEYTITAVG